MSNLSVGGEKEEDIWAQEGKERRKTDGLRELGWIQERERERKERCERVKERLAHRQTERERASLFPSSPLPPALKQ